MSGVLSFIEDDDVSVVGAHTAPSGDPVGSLVNDVVISPEFFSRYGERKPEHVLMVLLALCCIRDGERLTEAVIRVASGGGRHDA